MSEEKLDKIIRMLEKLLRRVPTKYEQWLNDGCCGDPPEDEDD